VDKQRLIHKCGSLLFSGGEAGVGLNIEFLLYVFGERGCSGLRKVSRRDFLKSLGGLTAVSGQNESRGSSRKDTVTPVLHQEKEIPFVCTACDRGCGVLLTVRGGEVVGFEGDPDHPANQGFLCELGTSLFRLSLPKNGCHWTPPLLYRPAGSAAWEAKDWGWVLRTIALRIKEVLDAETEGGSEEEKSIGCFWDDSYLTNEERYLLFKFLQALGVPVRNISRQPGAFSFGKLEDFAGRGFPGDAKESNQDSVLGRLRPQDELADRLTSGNTKGLFIWGGGLLQCEPGNQTSMLRSPQWLVLVNWFKNREDFAASCAGITETYPKTEAFVLPAAAPWEKSGSVISAGRWVQWCIRAAEPQEQVKTPLWIIDRLFVALRDAYHGSGVSSGGVVKVKWDYAGKTIPDAVLVAAEMYPSFLEHGRILDKQAASAQASIVCGLQDTGYRGGRELSMRRSLDHRRWGFLLPQ